MFSKQFKLNKVNLTRGTTVAVRRAHRGPTVPKIRENVSELLWRHLYDLHALDNQEKHVLKNAEIVIVRIFYIGCMVSFCKKICGRDLDRVIHFPTVSHVPCSRFVSDTAFWNSAFASVERVHWNRRKTCRIIRKSSNIERKHPFNYWGMNSATAEKSLY